MPARGVHSLGCRAYDKRDGPRWSKKSQMSWSKCFQRIPSKAMRRNSFWQIHCYGNLMKAVFIDDVLLYWEYCTNYTDLTEESTNTLTLQMENK